MSNRLSSFHEYSPFTTRRQRFTFKGPTARDTELMQGPWGAPDQFLTYFVLTSVFAVFDKGVPIPFHHPINNTLVATDNSFLALKSRARSVRFDRAWNEIEHGSLDR